MKILVVDDSATIRHVLRRELESGGLDVTLATNGDSALALTAEHDFDLITLDVEMPGMSGFEVCAKLRENVRTESVPVVFITSNDTIEHRERGFELGAADFIIKTHAQGELLDRIRNALALSAPLKGITALVVEDSIVARLVLTGCLRAEGITVIEAENGTQAIELLRNDDYTFDLIITDFMMPRMNGDELCRFIRNELHMTHIPIIFLSAVSEKSSILEMFRAGATDYLMKPFAKEELMARVRVHIENRQLTQQLSKQVDEMTRLNKLKDDFLAVASHDLRSPLAGIIGIARMLVDEENIQTEHKELLALITESGEHLLQLINELLDLALMQSKNDTLKLQPVPIAPLTESVHKAFEQLAAAKNISMRLINRLEDPSAHVRGDRNSLRRILNNLISNAIKFTPAGGSITLTVQPEGQRDTMISVADTGVGINELDIPKLFDKLTVFTQTGTAGEIGTGLGLAITKELVEKQNGLLEVESVAGSGTTFRVYLPSLA